MTGATWAAPISAVTLALGAPFRAVPMTAPFMPGVQVPRADALTAVNTLLEAFGRTESAAPPGIRHIQSLSRIMPVNIFIIIPQDFGPLGNSAITIWSIPQ